LGRWANTLADSIKKSDRLKIVSCFSRSEKSREGFSQQYACRAAKSYAELLSDPEVEGVLVTTPNDAHAQPILEAAYEEMRPLIEAKGQQVSRHVAPEQLLANVDAPKMMMALTNLLNNAMRFTPGGGRIELGLERHGAEAWLRVRDNGVGLPADQLERVFDQFYQVEHHMTRRHEGMGLGLSIVRAVVRAHSGRVWAESAGRDQGATFTIAVPLAS